MTVLNKRRRLENKTNYSKRKRLLEGAKARIVVRKSNRYIIAQYVESVAAQDIVKASATSQELTSYGWPGNMKGSLKSLPAAYMTGFILGKRIKDFGKAILDIGLIRSTKGSRIYAVVKGIKDAGFEIPCSEEIMPSDEMINRNEKINLKEIKSELELESKIKKSGGKSTK